MARNSGRVNFLTNLKSVARWPIKKDLCMAFIGIYCVKHMCLYWPIFDSKFYLLILTAKNELVQSLMVMRWSQSAFNLDQAIGSIAQLWMDSSKKFADLDLWYMGNRFPLCISGPLPNHPAPSRSSCVGPSAAWRRASSPPPLPSHPPPGRGDLGTGWSFCWSPKRGARSIQESERVWICDLRSRILISKILWSKI